MRHPGVTQETQLTNQITFYTCKHVLDNPSCTNWVTPSSVNERGHKYQHHSLPDLRTTPILTSLFSTNSLFLLEVFTFILFYLFIILFQILLFIDFLILYLLLRFYERRPHRSLSYLVFDDGHMMVTKILNINYMIQSYTICTCRSHVTGRYSMSYYIIYQMTFKHLTSRLYQIRITISLQGREGAGGEGGKC